MQELTDPIFKYPVKFRWSAVHEAFCRTNRIYLSHPLRIEGVHKIGQEIVIKNPIEVESYGSLHTFGLFSIGAHSFSFSRLDPGVRIGRYCSIGGGVELMSYQHPTGRFTTSPITYLKRWEDIARREFGGEWQIQPWNELAPAPRIGNDVWIGDGALLARGIRIGDGAVIAARAVVTRDVPPYAVMGGIPARVIRYRFSPGQISRLLELCWWDYNFIDLPKCRFDEIDEFSNLLADKIESGQISPWKPGVFDLGAAWLSVENPDG